MSNSMAFLVCSFIMLVFGLLFFYVEFKDQKKFSQGKNNRIFAKDGKLIYVFSIPHTKEQVIEILSHKNAQDRLLYEFDKESMEIGFKAIENGYYPQVVSIEVRYKMRFEAQEDSCLLYLKQISLFDSRNYVLMRMNAFWAVKVDAIPYEVKK